MNLWNLADHLYGGAWLTAVGKSAVIFAGTKALGNSWYGFANGVVWPYDCYETNSCPEEPPWPYNDRGFWADDYSAQILFFDPADLAVVAQGNMQTWEPQPYASMAIDSFFFDPEIDVIRYKRDLTGDTCFDRANGLIYIIEQLADEDKSIIHVWKVNETIKGDVNNDDSIDLKDIITALRILVGMEAPAGMHLGVADLSDDERVGIEDVLTILKMIVM